MIRQHKKNQKSKNFIVCLNPRCTQPQNRCLTTTLLHKHPRQCSLYYYPAQQIQNNHSNLSQYPNDNIGKAITKKFKFADYKSYLGAIISELRNKVQKLIQKFQTKLQQIYPFGQLQNTYQTVYNLQKIAKAIRQNNQHKYITKLINANLSKPNYTSLILLNQKYDQYNDILDKVYQGMKTSLNQIINVGLKNQSVKKSSEKFQKKIQYGLMKSKFISSSKIRVQNQTIKFPYIQNIASFLPWIYTDRSFFTGNHQLKIISQRFPTINNCGFLILQEHDIDTYPYHYFKSLFNQQGRGFQLIEGSDIQYVIPQTTTLTLKLSLGSNPKAQIYDSQGRSKYICTLREQRNYRMGIYGSGWSVTLIQLN